MLSTENPSSLVHFCCSAYRSCPTWISEKENIAAQRTMRRVPLVEV